jgi:hypothetical protein
MKHILFATALAVFVLASNAVAQISCSKATLSGGYGLTALGSLQPNNALPTALVGRVVFDGNGNFTIVRTISQNGIITQNAATSGTYTMNADCTGVITVGAGGLATNYNFVVDTLGTHIRAISVAPGQTFTLEASKQFIGQ